MRKEKVKVLSRYETLEEYLLLLEQEEKYDIVVHIPPKKKYTVKINIKAIRKGEPKILEPERDLIDQKERGCGD